MMKVGFHSFSSTTSSKYSTCRLASERVDSLSFSSFMPSFFKALVSHSRLPTFSPASVYLTMASVMVRRSKGLARSTGLPP
ncbi:hypothetical protein D3C72_2330460 [compost metagenome]